jgi:hypothetical protein
MLARAYSPRLGRFLSPDPIIADVLDRREHNPFAYARNDPSNTYDPTGLWGTQANPIPDADDDEIGLEHVLNKPDKSDKAGAAFGTNGVGTAFEQAVDSVVGGGSASANTNTSSSGGTASPGSSAPGGGVTGGGATGAAGGSAGAGTSGGSAGTGGHGGSSMPGGIPGGGAIGPAYEGPGGGVGVGRSGAGGAGGFGGTDGRSGHDGTRNDSPKQSVNLEWLSTLTTAIEGSGSLEETFGTKVRNRQMANFGKKAGKLGSQSGIVVSIVKVADGLRSGNEANINDGMASLMGSALAPLILKGRAGAATDFVVGQAIEHKAKQLFTNIRVVAPIPRSYIVGDTSWMNPQSM